MSRTDSFRARVYALWLEKQDTLAIAKALQVAEYDVERALHKAMLEAAGHAYNVLGGMPNFGSEDWFAVARLQKRGAAE